MEDETIGIQAVKDDAQDYLIKGQFDGDLLQRTIRYAVERHSIIANLRELDQRKSEFLSSVSHEIHTPLAIIRELVSLLRDAVPGPVNPEQEKCLDAVLRNCDRLTTLIGELLDLSRIQSGKTGSGQTVA